MATCTYILYTPADRISRLEDEGETVNLVGTMTKNKKFWKTKTFQQQQQNNNNLRRLGLEYPQNPSFKDLPNYVLDSPRIELKSLEFEEVSRQAMRINEKIK